MKKLVTLLLALCLLASLSVTAGAAAPDALVVAVDADIDTLHASD